MKSTVLLAVALIVLGAAVLGYRQFSYKSEEKVIDLGPFHATQEQTHTVAIPPILGWALIASGAAILVFGTRHKA